MNNKPKIKILKDGPYIVTGNVPLKEKIMVPKGHGMIMVDGRDFGTNEEWHLCWCGKSKNKPFCDGSHKEAHFDGTETAENNEYLDRAGLMKGPGVNLLDDERCAYARFCHAEKGDVWTMTRHSNDEETVSEVIRVASECPAGRLTAVTKDNEMIEPELKPELNILQDPAKNVSAGIWVKGYIEIEGADGRIYEKRNRYALCRCGKSENKPFCDANHVPYKFDDGHVHDLDNKEDK